MTDYKLREILSREYLESQYKDLSEKISLQLEYKSFRKINQDAFKRLEKLETLFLSGNQIVEINEPVLFADLSNLKILQLDNNKLKSIKPRTFQSLNLLERLDLDRNEIDQIYSDSFAGLVSVKTLWLNNNKISWIKPRTFESMKQLERLYLHKNQLDEIDPEAFVGLENLKVLGLNDNQLTMNSIARATFVPLASIGCVSLLNNNFNSRNVVVRKSIFPSSNVKAKFIISYFKESILKTKSSLYECIVYLQDEGHNLSKTKKIFSSSGGYISSFQEFLEQFSPNQPSKTFSK